MSSVSSARVLHTSQFVSPKRYIEESSVVKPPNYFEQLVFTTLGPIGIGFLLLVYWAVNNIHRGKQLRAEGKTEREIQNDSVINKTRNMCFTIFLAIT